MSKLKKQKEDLGPVEISLRINLHASETRVRCKSLEGPESSNRMAQALVSLANQNNDFLLTLVLAATVIMEDRPELKREVEQLVKESAEHEAKEQEGLSSLDSPEAIAYRESKASRTH